MRSLGIMYGRPASSLPFAIPLLWQQIPCFLITKGVVITIMSSQSAFSFEYKKIMGVKKGSIFIWLCLLVGKTTHLFSQFRGKISQIIYLLLSSNQLTQCATSDQFNTVKNTIKSGGCVSQLHLFPLMFPLSFSYQVLRADISL